MRDKEIKLPVSEVGVQPDGMVERDKLEAASRRNAAVRERFIDSLPENEREDGADDGHFKTEPYR